MSQSVRTKLINKHGCTVPWLSVNVSAGDEICKADKRNMTKIRNVMHDYYNLVGKY